MYSIPFRIVVDIERFVQFIPGSYKSDRPINFTEIDNVHLKSDCIKGSIVTGTREPFLPSFALSSKPGHNKIKQPRIKLFKKINEGVLPHITFYLDDEDHKPVDFNGQMISFTCKLNRLFYINELKYDSI